MLTSLEGCLFNGNPIRVHTKIKLQVFRHHAQCPSFSADHAMSHGHNIFYQAFLQKATTKNCGISLSLALSPAHGIYTLFQSKPSCCEPAGKKWIFHEVKSCLSEQTMTNLFENSSLCIRQITRSPLVKIPTEKNQSWSASKLAFIPFLSKPQGIITHLNLERSFELITLPL